MAQYSNFEKYNIRKLMWFFIRPAKTCEGNYERGTAPFPISLIHMRRAIRHIESYIKNETTI